MKSISNKCENLNDLTKINSNSTPSLSQGIKFKQDQNKFISKFNKNSGSNNIYESSFVENFEGSNTNPFLQKTLIFNDKQSYVTDKGIVRELLTFNPDVCDVKSWIWITANYPDAPGTYIPELKLTTGEPMTLGANCGPTSTNENMNFLGNFVMFPDEITYVAATSAPF